MSVNSFQVLISVSDVQYDAFPVTVSVTGARSTEVSNTWTVNDELGTFLGLSRRTGEELDDFAYRIKVAAKNVVGNNLSGIVSGVSSSTGIMSTWWAEITCSAGNPVIAVSDGKVTLSSSAGTYELPFLALDDDTGSVTPATLADLVSLISLHTEWSYSVVDTEVDLTSNLYHLMRQSNIQNVSFVISGGSSCRISRTPIVDGSMILLSRDRAMVREVPYTMKNSMRSGDYCVDTENGVVYIHDEITNPVVVTFNVRINPYRITYWDIGIVSIGGGTYSEMLFSDGTPSWNVERLIYKSNTTGARTFWSSKQ